MQYMKSPMHATRPHDLIHLDLIVPLSGEEQKQKFFLFLKYISRNVLRAWHGDDLCYGPHYNV